MRLRIRAERGQTMGLMAIALTAMVGMTGFVLDVGAWFRADRQLQVVADAAALAGAQLLPRDPGEAIAVATEYGTKNDGPAPESMAVEKDVVTNDTISVSYKDEAPGFFTRVLGIDSVTVRATAKARASTPAGARWVAPIVVSEKHPRLRCTSPGKCDPEFEVETELDLTNLHGPGSGDAAGAFGLINLKAGDKGSVGASTLSEWLDQGYNEMMEPGTFYSVPSAMFNSSDFRNALDGKIKTGDELLFPIYRTIVKSGSTAEYTIVGWVGFVVTQVVGGGDDSKVKGYFTEVIWDGIPSNDTNGTPNFGAFVVALTD
jgi:Flp pilus assembly protein TadG